MVKDSTQDTPQQMSGIKQVSSGMEVSKQGIELSELFNN